jgi:hypothetical protein
MRTSTRTANAALSLREVDVKLEAVDGNRRHVEDKSRNALLREGRRRLQGGALGLDFVSRRGTPPTRARLARVAFDPDWRVFHAIDEASIGSKHFGTSERSRPGEPARFRFPPEAVTAARQP